MTIEATRRRSARAAKREEREEQLPIGEIDANIFNCPACARPLGVGTGRCPGCQTRLIAGVRATRAFGFVGIGLLVGTVIGSTVTGALAYAMVSLPTAVTTPGNPTAPGAQSAASAVPVAPVVVPADAVSALRQSSLVNQRLLADAGRIEAALSPKHPSAVDIARALRSAASDASFGDRVAPDIATWSTAAPFSADLVAYYARVGATARDGLRASLNNTAAYVEAGKAMRKLLWDLPDLDAQARALVDDATP